LKPFGHQAVARAQAAAAAAVGEQHNPVPAGRMDQRSRQAERRNRDLDLRPVVSMAQWLVSPARHDIFSSSGLNPVVAKPGASSSGQA
jgi:hypothetical protein